MIIIHRENMKEETKEWLDKAKEDMDIAEICYSKNKFGGVAFHSQQAAEKALKALQLEKLNKFDKVHDLVKLGESVGAPRNIIKNCDSLNPLYIETRYPISAKYSKSSSLKFKKYAKEVMEWVKKEIKS